MTIASVPAPMVPHQLLIFLLQVVLLLVLAFCLGRAAERLKMPAIVGELLAGVLLGPSLLGLVAPGFWNWLMPAEPEQARMLDGAAAIGVLLLVGVTGSYFDVGMLRTRRAAVARIGLAGLLVPFGFGVGAGYLLPDSLIPGGVSRLVFALFLGVAMCVTAIPVIAKTLADLRMLHRDVGQLILAAGLVADTVGWFLLSVVSALATVGVSMGYLSLSVLYLIGFVAIAVGARPLVRRVMLRANRSGQPGPPIAVTVIIVLIGAAITQALGLEAVFGAFVAGIVIGSVRSVEPATLAPLRTVVLWVLAPLFLASAGLRMDLTTLAEPGIALAAVVLLLVAVIGKFAGAYLGAKLSRLNNWEALAIGAGMNARGIVEVIIGTVGLRLGVISIGIYTSIVLVAVVTSLMSPPLIRWAMRRVAQTERETQREAEHEGWIRQPDGATPQPTAEQEQETRPRAA